MWKTKGGITVILLSVTALIMAGVAGNYYWHKQARITACQDHLRQIDQALQQYARNQGVYPPTLEALVQEKLLPHEATICPSGGGYIYCAASRKPVEIEPQAIIVFDQPDNHSGVGNVLYGDGKILKVSGKRLEGLTKLLHYTPLEAVIRVTKPATTQGAGD